MIIGSLIDMRSLETWVTLNLSLEEDLAKANKNQFTELAHKQTSNEDKDK
jgi:hypothetical protein